MNCNKMKIVILTGAGISADSGISTFREKDGLWANYKIEDVCTPQALLINRNQVIDFYNERRKEILKSMPNNGHLALNKLQDIFNVSIITQNIDNLHEKAGNQNITHLHGEITKLRSSQSELETIHLNGWEQDKDQRHSDGSLLRPFVVFFGENVPMLNKAIEITKSADLLIIIGTSLAVYPAASLVNYINSDCPIYIVDPKTPEIHHINNPIYLYQQKAKDGVPKLVNDLIKKYKK